MTIEPELIQERVRPRILQTDEIGRLDLGLPVAPQPGLVPLSARRFPSPFGVAVCGLGILVVGGAGVGLAQFVDGACAHGAAVGVLAATAVAAGIGGAGYWFVAELRGLLRLRS